MRIMCTRWADCRVAKIPCTVETNFSPSLAFASTDSTWRRTAMDTNVVASERKFVRNAQVDLTNSGSST